MSVPNAGGCTRHVAASGPDRWRPGWDRVRSAGERLILAAAAFGSLLCVSAPADAVSIGQAVRGHLAIGQKQVPLPAGAWTVAGVGVQDFDMPEIGAFGAIQNVVLLQHEGRRVVAMVEINVNSVPVNDGWGRTRSCQRGDQYLLVTRYRTGWDLSCLFVQTTASAGEANGPAAWRNARRAAAKDGLALPDFWLTAGFRISDRQDVVDARYHFDPAVITPGAASAGNAQGWTADAVRADPAKLAATEALSIWAIGFDGWVDRGLRNQLSGEAADMPNGAQFRSDTPQVDGKLLALERLYRAGGLRAADYVAQQRLALQEVASVVENPTGLPLSVQKNISFRVFGSSVDYILAFIVTLSSPLSAYITATIVSIHSVIFVLNDNYWEDYFARKSTRDAARVVDFAYVGATN